MIASLLPMLFVGAALASAIVIARHFARLPGQLRALAAAQADCAEMREVRFVIRTLDVVPEGGTVVRGRFSEVRRPSRPQSALPAAA